MITMFAIIIDEALLNVLELNYIELRTSLNTQVVIRGINLILGNNRVFGSYLGQLDLLWGQLGQH
jgi:hypothetical protein